MKVGGIFSGIYGFELGFEQAGFEIAWTIENDKFCQQLLRKQRPDIRIYGDIRKVFEMQDFPETVDVVCGGDPCPSRSVAKGNRKSRHPDLAGYFLALVGRLYP